MPNCSTAGSACIARFAISRFKQAVVLHPPFWSHIVEIVFGFRQKSRVGRFVNFAASGRRSSRRSHGGSWTAPTLVGRNGQWQRRHFPGEESEWIKATAWQLVRLSTWCARDAKDPEQTPNWNELLWLVFAGRMKKSKALNKPPAGFLLV